MAHYDFTESQRNTIWSKQFGNSYSGYDIFGRYVTKDNFEADHILPKAHGGRTIVNNAQVLHPMSNQEKSDELSGYVNGKWFQIKNNYDGTGDILV